MAITLETLSNGDCSEIGDCREIYYGDLHALKDAIRIILAFAAGSGKWLAGTSSIKFRSTGDDVDRFQAQ